MTILFHGSYTEVSSPLVKLGRTKVDFGQGFYLTTLQSQAEAWAKIISERRRTGTQAVVSTFILDMDGIKAEGYRIKTFESYNIEWLEYVIDCRRGGTLQNQYDLVEGGVANDNVIDTVEDYENGVITAEQALGQLKYKAVNHQLCILNQTIVDKYLTFVCSILFYHYRVRLSNMRDNVLWRKQSRIIMLLAETLNISAERALDLFYSTQVYQQLINPKSGLQLMSDQYILEDLIRELRK